VTEGPVQEFPRADGPLLQVGRIPFLVCAPYFHASLGGLPGVSFTDGPPRALNGLLAAGVLDCAPSSSFEYARNAKDYLLIPGLCTSGRGEVKSVLLFSRESWENLGGKSVRLSPDSDTSNALVHVLSRFRFGVEPVFVTEHSMDGPDDAAGAATAMVAMVAIGDAALRAAALATNSGQWAYCYDLARVWQEWQGTPLPFGLWIVREKAWSAVPDKLREYQQHLNRSLREFSAAPEACLRRWEKAFGLPFSVEQALDFFSTADYVLTPGHEKSLRVFFDLCVQAGLLAEAPPLRYTGT
jgi:chorismate dehydratase